MEEDLQQLVVKLRLLTAQVDRLQRHVSQRGVGHVSHAQSRVTLREAEQKIDALARQMAQLEASVHGRAANPA